MHKSHFAKDNGCVRNLMEPPNATHQTLKSLPRSLKFVLREPKEQRSALDKRKRCPAPPCRLPRDAVQTLGKLSKTRKDGLKHVQSRESLCKPFFADLPCKIIIFVFAHCLLRSLSQPKFACKRQCPRQCEPTRQKSHF